MQCVLSLLLAHTGQTVCRLVQLTTGGTQTTPQQCWHTAKLLLQATTVKHRKHSSLKSQGSCKQFACRGCSASADKCIDAELNSSNSNNTHSSACNLHHTSNGQQLCTDSPLQTLLQTKVEFGNTRLTYAPTKVKHN
jgi:hypothetical protein